MSHPRRHYSEPTPLRQRAAQPPRRKLHLVDRQAQATFCNARRRESRVREISIRLPMPFVQRVAYCEEKVIESPTKYPLQWPIGKPRTRDLARGRGPFKTARDGMSAGNQSITIAGALNRLRHELDLLRCRAIVISTNIPIRKDGFPYSSPGRIADPGVAVYFNLDGDPVALACDRYNDVAQNLAAVAAHVNASRAIERHGVGKLREIFRGFMALSAAMAVDDWCDVLGNPETLELAEARYIAKMRRAHPDAGGSDADAAVLNAAIAKARAALR